MAPGGRFTRKPRPAPTSPSQASSELLSGQLAVQRGQEMDKGLRLLSSAAMTSLKQSSQVRPATPASSAASPGRRARPGLRVTPGTNCLRPLHQVLHPQAGELGQDCTPPLEPTAELTSFPHRGILQVAILKFVFEITAWSNEIETSGRQR